MRGVTKASRALPLAVAGILATFINLNLPRGPAEAISSQTQPASVSETHPVAKAHVQDAYGKLPLTFEANHGQINSQVKFLSRGPGYTLWLTGKEAVFAVGKSKESEADVLRLQFLRATTASKLRGLEEQPGKVNYFIGNDPGNWRSNIPTFAKIRQLQLYPGIDIVYYGNQRQLEFDFIVAPGANPNKIRLKVDGAKGMELDADGNLVLHMSSGDIQLQRPHIYQEVDGNRKTVRGQYVIKDSEIRFQVAEYDASLPLVIDPTLVYSTYLGGSTTDEGLGIAVDATGQAHVTGHTFSANFPATAGAFQTGSAGGFDAFVTKLNSTGSGLLYSTYLGGSSDDEGFGIAVDATGQAYVTGRTFSANFPVTVGAF